MSNQVADGADVADPLIDLQRLTAGIRWRQRVWISVAAAAALGGMAVPLVLPAASTAATRIFVVHEEGGDTVSSMQTDLAVLETTTVAAEAVGRLKIDTPPERFVGQYSGLVVAGGILEVTARGNTDAQAMDVAKAVADAFVAIHIKQTDDVSKAEFTAIDDRRTKARTELDQVNAGIAAAPPAAQPQSLVDRRNALTDQITDLSQRAEAAELGSPRIAAGTQIIDAPHVTSRSTLVSMALYGVVGLLLGLGLGLGFAAIATVVRDRPVLRRDIAAHLGASVIAQVPAPIIGPSRLWKHSRIEVERQRTAATITRAVRAGSGPVSILELGCPGIAAEMAKGIADKLAEEHPVLLVDDLPGDELSSLEISADTPVRRIDGSEFPPAESADSDAAERRIGVGTVSPGSAWTDLRRLATETMLIVRAGRTETSWLHTVARQLADAGIAVIGVVVVHPDPRDRSDGTLWNAVNTAIRGRLAAAGSEPLLAAASDSVVLNGTLLNGTVLSGAVLNGAVLNGAVLNVAVAHDTVTNGNGSASRTQAIPGVNGVVANGSGRNGSGSVGAVSNGSNLGPTDSIGPGLDGRLSSVLVADDSWPPTVGFATGGFDDLTRPVPVTAMPPDLGPGSRPAPARGPGSVAAPGPGAGPVPGLGRATSPIPPVVPDGPATRSAGAPDRAVGAARPTPAGTPGLPPTSIARPSLVAPSPLGSSSGTPVVKGPSAPGPTATPGPTAAPKPPSPAAARPGPTPSAPRPSPSPTPNRSEAAAGKDAGGAQPAGTDTPKPRPRPRPGSPNVPPTTARPADDADSGNDEKGES